MTGCSRRMEVWCLADSIVCCGRSVQSTMHHGGWVSETTVSVNGYSQFDVMSGAELGVHAARRAALRRRIRALQWSALRYPRPVRFSCLMLVFAASVRALVTPVIRKTSISVHHAWSTSSG